ncbi:hypothetical protein HCJ46_04255 [Listeria booriae]|uniref:hypothetical protein n=1 Tax=Listeria booriae TaxID=1552123 RepID=UPI0016257CA1|nr:hypothetical protein [Listeria booriae]MBC1917952.1 hypothetical protein [Listeria booriae]
MINNVFYEGFEGESELSFVSSEDKLIIWNGYFETILDTLIDSGVDKKGMLSEYFNHEGWYDDSPWLLRDTKLALEQLQCFDVGKVCETTMTNKLSNVVNTIIMFLEKHISEDIYIEYD